MADCARTNFAIVDSIPDGVKLIDRENPTYLPKALKNPVEVGFSRSISLTPSGMLSTMAKLVRAQSAIRVSPCLLYTSCLMEFEVVRYNELKRYIGTISHKTLSLSLKELERDGLIHREEYPQIPPKVEYSLTETGQSLMKILDQLCIWGEQHKDGIG